MQSIRLLFKDHPDIKKHPAVQELIREYDRVSDELIDLQQRSEFNKEKPLLELIRDIQTSIKSELARDVEAERFGETERVDFKESLKNLDKYIDRYKEDYKIRI